jgi:predicted MFS family arabinose efflux permease
MLLGAGRLCAAATALSLPALAARWSKATLIVATAGGTALSMAPLILLPAWGAAAISFIGVVSLMSIRIPIFLVYTMEAVGPARRGLMSGAGEMANGLGFALIGLSGGYLIGELGYRPLFLLGASLTAAGTFIFFKYCRKTPELSDALAPS